jgi:alkylation response protein AidB-like acyl-CoA dehydrogenase
MVSGPGSHRIEPATSRESLLLDLEAAEEHLAVAEVSKNIGLELLYPAARDAEAARSVPQGVWRALLDTGLTVPVPEELGGGGVPDAITQMIATENLAYGDPGITLAAVWSGAAAFLLSRHASTEQAQLLADLVGNPDARGALALYEGYGRAPWEYQTTVAVQADGSVKVTGHKVSVPFAAEVENIIVVGLDATSGALRAVLVPAAAGVTIEENPSNLALDATSAVSVSFDVTVPVANLIGGPDADAQTLATTVERIRLLVAAVQVGTAQRAIEYAAHYATERIAFGKPIAAFQGISFPLAESQMQLEELRLEIYEVAACLETEPGQDFSSAVTAVVNYAGEVAAEATRTAVQTLGGHGFIKDHPVELWYRSAAALSALDFDPTYSSFQPAL